MIGYNFNMTELKYTFDSYSVFILFNYIITGIYIMQNSEDAMIAEGEGIKMHNKFPLSYPILSLYG